MNKNKSVLESVNEKISIKVSNPKDPGDFFQSRDGLYVFSDFKEKILSKADILKSETLLCLTSFDLIKSASDEKIESELPEKHLFSESEVCAVVAELISKQEKRKSGDLLTNGYANLFYTPYFVVSVRWDAGYGGWRVSTWGRGGCEWSAVDRVFSQATDL